MSIDQHTGKASPTRSTSRSMLTKPSAFSMQRELQQSTKSLQIEKRRFLQLQEECKKVLKSFQTQKDQLNELLRATHSNSVTSLPIKASNILHSSNKLHSENEFVVSQIRALRDEITLLRKERVKHIRLAEKLNVDLKDMEDRIKDTDDKIDGLKQTNDFIKTEILEFRNRTITDIKDFKTSYNSLTQNYFTERKYFDGQLRKSRDRQANDIQTNALPILKERLRKLIHKNRQKMKIVTDFKKACNQVNRMFAIMRDYKGKDDVDFIAREFVEKQNMISKLEEHIDHLENRIGVLQLKKGGIEGEANKIQEQLETVDGKLAQRRERREHAELLRRDIRNLDEGIRGVQKQFDIFAPTFQSALIKLRQSKFNRQGDNPEEIKINFSLQKSTLLRVLGEMEKYIVLVKPPLTNSPTQLSLKERELSIADTEKEPEKEVRVDPKNLPPEDNETIKQELLNYDRLKQIACEIINKKSSLLDVKKKP